MYLGHLCEIAPAERLYQQPAHPYTRALLNAIPRLDPEVSPSQSGLLLGELPSATEPPSGCRFHTRCPRAQSECAEIAPIMQSVAKGHLAACHHPHLSTVDSIADSCRPQPLSVQEQR